MFHPPTHGQTPMSVTPLPCPFLPIPFSDQTQPCLLLGRNLEQAFLIAALNTTCPLCERNTVVFLSHARRELRRVYPDLIQSPTPVMPDQTLLYRSRVLQQLWLFASHARPPRS